MVEGGLLQLPERGSVVGYPLRFKTLRQPEGSLQTVDEHPLRRRLFIQLRLPVDKDPPVIAVAHQPLRIAAGQRQLDLPPRRGPQLTDGFRVAGALQVVIKHVDKNNE